MWRWRLIPVVLAMTLMAGCATYRTPKGSDVAILRGVTRNAGVTSVDNSAACSWLRDSMPEVKLSPGKHTIGVLVAVGLWYFKGDLWLVAEPHGEYELNYHAKDMKVAIWIIDKKTGLPVGGVKGSDDEPPDAGDPPVDSQDDAPVPQRTI